MNLDIYTGKDLWEYLQETKKTVVMYGMGNGADKILKVLEEKGVEVADFFASDGFVRGHSFHGKTVLSYSQTKEKYGKENIIVLLSFATSLPDVIENILKIADECELYAPDVPVFGSTLFDKTFYNSHVEEMQKVYNLLEDEESKTIYKNTLMYKLTGKISYLEDRVSHKDEVYTKLLKAEKIEKYADMGAYNGDTVRELAEYSRNLKNAVAFEPDRRTFKKLELYAQSEERFEVKAVNCAAWNENTVLTFDAGGNRNSNVTSVGKTVEIQGKTLDCEVFENGVDYIKYDVEGAEKEALSGSEKTLEKYLPHLLVSVYHRSEDIFALPLAINAKFPQYKLYLRRYRYIPAWDLNLMCINTHK